MPSLSAGNAPNLSIFLKSLKSQQLDSSIENLISLLKRRQIKNSRPCAIATANLLLRVVAKFRWTDIGKLLERIQEVGQRLIEAQPREMVVGNIVRRVLGMIRDEAKEDRHEDASDSASNSQMSSPHRQHSDLGQLKGPGAPPSFSPLRFDSLESSRVREESGDDVFGNRPPSGSRPPLLTSHTSYAVLNGATVAHSMFNLLSATGSPLSTPGNTTPQVKPSATTASINYNLKSEVISGIGEIIDELDQVDDQIASYAQDHIHSNETILTHSSSKSVQRFLLKAAELRKFTVIVAESYPNDHEATHASVMGKNNSSADDADEMDTELFLEPLSQAGITVIQITDAAVFAVMSRVNKVILATHAVIANGGLVAAAGARGIAKAANFHKTPVIVVTGVYKLSPEYPFEFESLIEYGDPGNIISYHDGPLVEKLEVDNPVYDYVPPHLVDLYITNLGAHAPSYLYRIVEDHYKTEDINFHNSELRF